MPAANVAMMWPSATSARKVGSSSWLAWYLEALEEHKPTSGGRRPRGGGGRREKTETKETPEEKAEKDMNQVCKTWSQALGDDARGCQSMAVELQGLQKKQLAGHVEILGQHASTLREMRDKLDEKWSSKQWNEVKKFLDTENPRFRSLLMTE